LVCIIFVLGIATLLSAFFIALLILISTGFILLKVIDNVDSIKSNTHSIFDTTNGKTVQIKTDKVAPPILDNEPVYIIAIFQPTPNKDGLDSVALAFCFVKEYKKNIDLITDETSSVKIKDWLL
jgi:hypothetical protein